MEDLRRGTGTQQLNTPPNSFNSWEGVVPLHPDGALYRYVRAVDRMSRDGLGTEGSYPLGQLSR